MNISFQQKNGNRALGIEFFWAATIKAKRPVNFADHFIPELYFDYLFVKKGEINWIDVTRKNEFRLGQQTLKTLFTRPLIFTFTPPLVLFGARLSLRFAEAYWNNDLRANSFLGQDWANPNTKDFATFASQISSYVQSHRRKKNPYPLLSPDLAESNWLRSYSPRHKRRLYKATFGLSRKEIKSLRSLHSFLEQTCSFDSQPPRIIGHVDPDYFYDQPHLNHAFRKMTGLSPVEYFEASSILQDNLMAASYNAPANEKDNI